MFRFAIGNEYRRNADELFSCQKDFLKALRNLQRHQKLSEAFVFSEEMIQLASAQCMHYLHGYFELYPPTPSQEESPVRRGMLLVAILSMTLKVLTHEYVIEHRPTHEQLELFEVQVPYQHAAPATGYHDAQVTTKLQ